MVNISLPFFFIDLVVINGYFKEIPSVVTALIKLVVKLNKYLN